MLVCKLKNVIEKKKLVVKFLCKCYKCCKKVKLFGWID